MKKTKTSAKIQLNQVIKKLNKEAQILSTEDLIFVLKQVKSICSNKPLVEGLLQSIKVLKQAKIYRKGDLTNREQQVLLHIGNGLKSSAIATQLEISQSTIETHRKNIRKKLKLNGKDNLFALALLFSLQYNHKDN